MIQLVTFDFWETLVSDSNENRQAQDALRIRRLGAALERAGAALAEPALTAAYHGTTKHLVEHFWSKQRDLSASEQVRAVLDCCAPGAAARLGETEFQELVEGYGSPLLTYPPELSPGAADAVRTLAERGITLGIISNTGRTPGLVLRRILEGHELLRYFTVLSYSDEIGYRKPDPAIFRHALERAGTPVSAAFHVGDNPVDDVAGARSIGMRAVHYAPRGSTLDGADLTIRHLAELPAELFRVAS